MVSPVNSRGARISSGISVSSRSTSARIASRSLGSLAFAASTSSRSMRFLATARVALTLAMSPRMRSRSSFSQRTSGPSMALSTADLRVPLGDALRVHSARGSV